MKIQLIDPEKLLIKRPGEPAVDTVIERRLRLALTRFADDVVQVSLALSKSRQLPEVVTCELIGKSKQLGQVGVTGQGLDILEVVSALSERLARTLGRRLDAQAPLS